MLTAAATGAIYTMRVYMNRVHLGVMMSNLRLSVRHVRILLTLADGPLHGYAISAAIERETGGAIALRPGSLYRAIHQLLERGLIEEIPEEGDDPRRRTYRSTRAGKAAVADELALLDGLIRHGRRMGVLPARP